MATFLCAVCNKYYEGFAPENVGAVLDSERRFIGFKFMCFSCLEKEGNT